MVVRLISRETKRAGYIYTLQVPAHQEELARQALRAFKSSFQ